MRNLARYPLTLDEILKILADQAKAIESEQRIGDIQPLALRAAAPTPTRATFVTWKAGQ